SEPGSDPGLPSRATSLLEKAKDIETKLGTHFGVVGTELAVLSLDELSEWLKELWEASHDTEGVIRRTTEIVGTSIALDDIKSLLDARAAVEVTEALIQDSLQADSELLGPLYQGLVTAWEQVEETLAWS